MVKTSLGALVLAALPSALAFRNTSPFFLFSTANLNLPNADAAIAQASQTTADVLEAIKDCPTKSYVVVRQKGVSAADYADGHSAVQLAQYMAGKDQAVKTTYAIPDVVGDVDKTAIVTYLKLNCGNTITHTNEFKAPVAAIAERTRHLQSMDDKLSDFITQSQDFTVIYITTPIDESVAKAQLHEDSPPYEMESPFGSFDQLELKRDLSSHVKRADATANDAGLFERYQYFTPGIFMGLIAAVPLFLILLVGVRALTSLEVSYFAFSKEMGPNAQKK